MAMEDTIVLYPSPGRSHLVPMVELGKLILRHNPNSFTIAVIISSFLSDLGGDTSRYIADVSATNPGITFHHLPVVSHQKLTGKPSFFDVPMLRCVLALLNNPGLHQTLVSLSKAANVKALVVDYFCKAALEVSSGLNIPTYFFYTSGASALAQVLYLPVTFEMTNGMDVDPETLLDVPGLPPIRAKDISLGLNEGVSVRALKYVMDHAIQMTKSSGIIVNTFEALERRAFKALKDVKCVPDGDTMPPVYCTGPILATGDHKSEDHECFGWLDEQPSNSVVFLCFGSMELLSTKQLKEMAVGLERSAVRFLWVVRVPPPEDEFRRTLTVAEPSLESFLPEGFLERTKDKGLVVDSWAPQFDVLSHDSVGGFVTHCGWNSILEAVSAGVPMVAWPIFAEQPVNRALLAEEIKVALPIEKSEDGLVSAAELEKRVTELMNSEKGKDLRERIGTMKEQAAAALSDGGSSRTALLSWLSHLKEKESE